MDRQVSLCGSSARPEAELDDAAHGAAERLERCIGVMALDRPRHPVLRSRRKSFIIWKARERRRTMRVQEAADRVYAAQVETCGDIAPKLAVAAAVDEPIVPQFPLRHLLADVIELFDVRG